MASELPYLQGKVGGFEGISRHVGMARWGAKPFTTIPNQESGPWRISVLCDSLIEQVSPAIPEIVCVGGCGLAIRTLGGSE